MKGLAHILLLSAFVLAVSCHSGPRLIEQEDMEEVVYRMLVQDQQIKQNFPLKPVADTSLVYEGVFRSMGYNTDDFLFSMNYYLEDPTRMEDVMEAVAGRLDQEEKEVSHEIELVRWRRRMMRLYDIRPNLSSLPQPAPSAVDSLPVRFSPDSLYLVRDSSLFPAPVDSLAL